MSLLSSLVISLLMGAFALLRIRPRLRETTLPAVWHWSLAALVIPALVEIALRMFPDAFRDTSAEALRLAARMLLGCPLISLVGVKRPQDRAWNYVVASLWCVLALPAAEAYLLQSGRNPTVVGARAWFLAAVLMMTVVNSLFTRFALPGLLAVLGQAVLLHDYLPWRFDVRPTLLPIVQSAGFLLLAFAALLFSRQSERTKATTSLDALWLDFRDYFGLFWSLRVQERLNAASTMLGWSVRLEWEGWVDLQGVAIVADPAEEEFRAILQTFRGLLRRFVSNPWIEERISRPIDATKN